MDQFSIDESFITNDKQIHGKGALMRDNATAIFVSACSSHPYMLLWTRNFSKHS